MARLWRAAAQKTRGGGLWTAGAVVVEGLARYRANRVASISPWNEPSTAAT